MQSSVVKFATILAIFIFAILFIPTKFYLDLVQKEDEKSEEILLDNWADQIVFKIRVFENKIDDIFIFPRSVYFDATLEDEHNNILFSTMQNRLDLPVGVSRSDGKIFKKIELEKNIFNAKYLTVNAPNSYSEYYLRVFILLLIFLPIFFVGSFALLTLFLRPFEEKRKLEELFFKDAMHEIKTPLGIIMLNLELLSEKIEENIYIKRARYAVKNLSIIYEDIEHFIREKYIVYNKEHIDFSYFLQDRVEFFSEAALISNIKVITAIEKNIFINFSRVELLRIVDNNLSNAIKYNRQNGTVDIGLSRSDGKIVLTIKDSGKGIKDINKIFTRHYRGDEIKGGFGIGLAIVKAICDKNRVDIKVESTVGIGSSFSYFF